MLVVNAQLAIPLAELEFTFSRSAGPGGQNVNKVNSKATLRWAVTKTSQLPEPVKQRFLERFQHRLTNEGEILIHSQRFRDQGRNVTDCLEKLKAMVAEVAATPKKRRPTKPTKGSKHRRLKEKRGRAETKQLRKKPRSEE